jgi:hypothetical protein
MKITKAQLKQIIKEELKEGGFAGHYDKTQDSQNSTELVNAVLSMQEIRGDEYTVKVLREMADDIEREAMTATGPAL